MPKFCHEFTHFLLVLYYNQVSLHVKGIDGKNNRERMWVFKIQKCGTVFGLIWVHLDYSFFGKKLNTSEGKEECVFE